MYAILNFCREFLCAPDTKPGKNDKPVKNEFPVGKLYIREECRETENGNPLSNRKNTAETAKSKITKNGLQMRFWRGSHAKSIRESLIPAVNR